MVKIIVISGYGLNCEEETKFAFLSINHPVQVDIVHVNDIIIQPKLLRKYNIMAIPGGFSYGDHTGAGNAFSWYLENHVLDELQEFRMKDKLIIGICNGCQIITRLFSSDLPVSLSKNDSGEYKCKWVDVVADEANNNIWLKNIDTLRIPIAHAEGKFCINNLALVNVVLRYENNPNGSDLDAAAISSLDGKILAIMPHPERAITFYQQDQWPLLKEQYIRQNIPIPQYGKSLTIFQNAVEYFM